MTAPKIVALLFFCFFSHTTVLAEPFLKVEPGAPALGVGGAFTAMVDEATASYWNPARLALLRHTWSSAAGLQLGSGGGSASLLYASGAYRLNNLGFGVWWVHHGLSDVMEDRGILGAAISLTTGVLQMGGGMKLMSQTTDTFSASGIGLDLSAMADFLDMISIGLMMQDILQTKLKVGEKIQTSFNPTYRVSGSFRLGSFTFSSEALLHEEELQSLRFGVEVRLAGIIAIRAGRNNDLWSWGVGIGSLEQFRLDVANRQDLNNDDVWMVSGHVAF